MANACQLPNVEAPIRGGFPFWGAALFDILAEQGEWLTCSVVL